MDNKEGLLAGIVNKARVVVSATVIWWSMITMAQNPEVTLEQIKILRSGGRDGAVIQPKP